MSYGLKGKVRQMVTEMQQVRNPGPTGIAKDVTLREHMAKNYKTPNGEALSPNHLFAELGIDENYTTVNDVMKDEDTRYLMAETHSRGRSPRNGPRPAGAARGNEKACDRIVRTGHE
jgi:hypothetical protein